MSQNNKYTDVVNKRYGKWVKEFLNVKGPNGEIPDPDEISIIIGEEVPFTRQELWKLIKGAFINTMHDHGREVDLSWAHSFYKRLWGHMRQVAKDKRALLLEKQQGNVDYHYNAFCKKFRDEFENSLSASIDFGIDDLIEGIALLKKYGINFQPIGDIPGLEERLKQVEKQAKDSKNG